MIYRSNAEYWDKKVEDFFSPVSSGAYDKITSELARFLETEQLFSKLKRYTK